MTVLPPMNEPTTYWIAMTHPLVAWAQIAARIVEHTDYLDELAAGGQALATGPFLHDGAPRGEGLTILRAADLVEARRLADGDPLVRAGLWRMEVHLWQVHPLTTPGTLEPGDVA